MSLRIVDLQSVEPDAEAVFGGKACGLARLIASGANVPAGFAVAASASPPQQWSDGERGEFRRRTDLLLAHGVLAVRSSAVGEDAANRSFAGLFETVLGVSDSEAALEAAARCIASALSDRVRTYAGVATPPPVGLVVQAQVQARSAGVCFTIDPSGQDEALVIEAVAGSGDELVSGRAQPERWRVYRSGLGTWEVRPYGSRQQAAVLDHGAVIRIAEQAMGHARSLGRPLDLEWAFDRSGGLWWLQARPITAAVAPLRVHVQRAFDGADDGPVTVWANFNVRETIPDPLMPLTWSIWRDVIHAMITDLIFGTPRSSPLFPHLLCLDLVQGRIYFNMNGVLGWPVVGSLMRRVLRGIDAQAAAVCEDLMARGVLRARRLPGPSLRRILHTLRANLTSTRRFAIALRPHRAMETLRGFETVMARRRAARPLASLPDRDLFHELHLVTGPEFASMQNALHCEGLAIIIYNQALRAFRDFPDASRLLAAGIPENPTTQISVGIDELVMAARPLAPLFREPLTTTELIARLGTHPDGRAWLTRFQDFLARFGHRCPKEFDIGATRWKEDPAMLVDLVRVGLDSGAERMSDRLERLAHERRRAVAAAVAAALWWRRPLLRGLARLVELYMPLREAPKHYAMIGFERMRDAALELGARFTERGYIAAHADVFFVELPEIEQLIAGNAPNVDFRERVGARRARFDEFRTHRAPDFVRSDGVPVVAGSGSGNASEGGILRGTAISAGKVSGPVRILTDPDPTAMADGDVIVMEFADPGWTPLFPRAVAVVMEVGGLMCHAAVVARELGIPAVFGISGATHILQNGDPVTVDGAQGTVTPCKIQPETLANKGEHTAAVERERPLPA